MQPTRVDLDAGQRAKVSYLNYEAAITKVGSVLSNNQADSMQQGNLFDSQ